MVCSVGNCSRDGLGSSQVNFVIGERTGRIRSKGIAGERGGALPESAAAAVKKTAFATAARDPAALSAQHGKSLAGGSILPNGAERTHPHISQRPCLRELVGMDIALAVDVADAGSRTGIGTAIPRQQSVRLRRADRIFPFLAQHQVNTVRRLRHGEDFPGNPLPRPLLDASQQRIKGAPRFGRLQQLQSTAPTAGHKVIKADARNVLLLDKIKNRLKIGHVVPRQREPKPGLLTRFAQVPEGGRGFLKCPLSAAEGVMHGADAIERDPYVGKVEFLETGRLGLVNERAIRGKREPQTLAAGIFREIKEMRMDHRLPAAEQKSGDAKIRKIIDHRAAFMKRKLPAIGLAFGV